MSKQNYGTPPEFVSAVERAIGKKIAVDLAADSGNSVCSSWIEESEDSLTYDWYKFYGLLFLNPPYEDIEPWAKKCAQESEKGAHIVMLIPAAIGTNYFSKWIHPYARVYALSPRIAFLGGEPNPKTGKNDPYKKDLMLCEYGPDVVPQLLCWRWKP